MKRIERRRAVKEKVAPLVEQLLQIKRRPGDSVRQEVQVEENTLVLIEVRDVL